MQFLNAILEVFNFAYRLPTKLSILRKQVGCGSTSDAVKRYVVCPACHKTYDMETLPLQMVHDPVEQILCNRKEFPVRNVSSCGHKLFLGACQVIFIDEVIASGSSLLFGAITLGLLFSSDKLTFSMKIARYERQATTL